jgi:hypothetical protein
MNRQKRRAQKAIQKQYVKQFSSELTVVPPSEWPAVSDPPLQCWRSSKYAVQLYNETAYPGMKRLSICRATVGTSGRWNDGLTWDELQAIKREVGFGDWYAIEVYPRDQDIVNVSNMRHLWLMPKPLPIGWFKED